jgi:hypothetical protein
MAIRIAKREGITRFWRGIVPSTIGNFPGQSSYYLAYETSQMVISRWIPNEDTKLARFTKGFLAGMGAEIAGGLFYVPADIVAQRLQIQDIKGFQHNSRFFFLT